MKSLYEITEDALAIISELEQNELTDELLDRLAISQEELQNKATNYAYVIKDAEANVLAINNEIERLNALKKAENRKIEVLKERISGAMNLYGIEKVQTPTIKMSFRASKSVEIINEDQIDKQFIKEKLVKSVDKIAIKKAIESGDLVEGALLQSNKNLVIK